MIHLSHRNPHNGQTHFYHLEIVTGLFGQWGVQREWGRKGQHGTLRVDWYGSQEAAQTVASQLAEAKLEAWWRKSNPTSVRQNRRTRTPKPKLNATMLLEQTGLS